jgi:hypothetical protein
MRRLVIPLAAAILAFPGGAGAAQPVDPADLAELQANRQLWKSKGIEDYTYKISRSCFCAVEFTRQVKIVVKNGKHQSGGGKAYRSVNTLDKLFRVARAALDDDVFSISYSPRFGFPKSISSNPELMVADEEVSYQVRGFDPAGCALPAAVPRRTRCAL